MAVVMEIDERVRPWATGERATHQPTVTARMTEAAAEASHHQRAR